MKTVTVMSIAVFLLLAPSVASQVPDDKLIVPGQRIGKWTLEMTVSALVQMNGQADAIDTPAVADIVPPPPKRYIWDALGFAVITRDDRSVAFFLVSNNTFKTEGGVGPGSSRGAVQNTYGIPTVETRVTPTRIRMIYDAIGFAANVDGDLVVGINIFRPGTGKTVWSFQAHSH